MAFGMKTGDLDGEESSRGVNIPEFGFVLYRVVSVCMSDALDRQS